MNNNTAAEFRNLRKKSGLSVAALSRMIKTSDIQRILEANLDLTYQAFSTGSNTELNTAAKDCE